MLRWLEEGRSSIVVGLAAALLVPSVNTVVFDGIPLDNAWEVLATAALLPFIFSRDLRSHLHAALTRRHAGMPRVVLALLALVIVAKLVLLAAGTDRGFVACYESTLQPPTGGCEKSYSNPFGRNGGATRVDQELDFGPSGDQGASLITAPDIPVEREGVAVTNWNLSFANDLRFNLPPSEAGNVRALMPFTVAWDGTASIPGDGVAVLAYAGAGSLEVGGETVALPPSAGPRRLALRLPAGDQPLHAEFTYAAGYRAPFGEFRLLDASGDPIRAAHSSIGQRVASVVVWLVLAVLFTGLAITAIAALGSDLLLLVAFAVAAIVLAVVTSGYVGFQYLAALVAPVIVWRSSGRPILLAYAALATITVIGLLGVAGGLGDVIYRAYGSDFLTYESYAREIVLNGSLRGGEDVFFYQPGSRYVLGLMHFLFGPGDVLVTFWSMLALSMPFAALLTGIRRGLSGAPATVAVAAIGFILLATLNSPTCLTIVAIGASETPTWALLPLAAAAPVLRPARQAAWIGSGAAAALIWVMRNNQAIAAATLLGAMAAALGKQRRRLLFAGGAVVLVIFLLPAFHNLAYGGSLNLSTTSISSSRVQEIGLADLPHVFDSTQIGSQIRGHIGAIFYDPPTPGLTEASFGWLLFALLGVWIAVAVVAIVRHRGDLKLPDWLLMLLPVAYLAPHVIYQVEVYYPRHIVAGYLAMGVSALAGVSAIGRRRTW